MYDMHFSEVPNGTFTAITLLLVVTYLFLPFYEGILYYSSQDALAPVSPSSMNSDESFSKQRTIPSPLNASRFVGGSYRDECTALQLDDRGGLHVGGWTNSPDFSTMDYENTTAPDSFLARMNQSLMAIDTQFFGGSDTDIVTDILVDTTGRCFLTGSTFSSDFPVKNASNSLYPGSKSDCFVSVIGADGNLIYSTRIGGSLSDFAQSIELAPDGTLFIVGFSESIDFPEAGSRYASHGTSIDAIVFGLDWMDDTIIFSERVGGSGTDNFLSGMKDGSGNLWITGYTYSADFPVTANKTGPLGESDIVLMRMSPTGTISTCHLIGGSSNDYGRALTTTVNHSPVLTGATESFDFPTTPNAIDRELSGPSDSYILEMNTNSGNPNYSTYLGGSGKEEGNTVIMDDKYSIYVAGSTRSGDFPLVNSLGAAHSGLNDVYAMKLDSRTNTISYATVIGGSNVELVNAMDLDDDGNLYLAGLTQSPDFPVTSSNDGFTSGFDEGFVVQLGDMSDSDNDFLRDFEEVELGTNRYSNDTDSDGLSDYEEIVLHETNPLVADSDGDGMPDNWEILYGLNATFYDANEDPDSDGLSNLQEFTLGTNPLKHDSDGDGMSDRWETSHGYDPNNPMISVMQYVEFYSREVLLGSSLVIFVFTVLLLKYKREVKHQEHESERDEKEAFQNLSIE
ncbi:MAG: hypothetical protein KGY80_05090 [Candidatus Thorarchaeota archaeon]|nr:hypothetical protein [Candidatus Thorarchaeota archaeon]